MHIVIREVTLVGVQEVEIDLRLSRRGAVLGDIVAAWGLPEDPARRVLIDGRNVDVDLGLDEAGLVDGAVIELIGGSRPPGSIAGLAAHAGTARTGAERLEVAVIGGPAAGRRCALRAALVVGRGSDADVVVGDLTVSPRHARLVVTGPSMTVEDLGSHNGTRVGGVAVRCPTSVGVGVPIQIGASTLVVREREVTDRPLGIDAERAAIDGAVGFNRPPRVALPQAPAVVEVPDPPVNRQRTRSASAVQLLGPVIMGLVMVQVLGSVRYALFALMSPVMFVANLVGERRRGRRESKTSRRRFADELHRFVRALDIAGADERRRLEALLPDPVELLRRVDLPSTRLWERRYNHTDYLLLRIGRGLRPWTPPVDTARADGDPELSTAVVAASNLRDAPIEAELADGGVVGIVGDRGTALALVRSLLCQAATLHGPADLAIAVLAAEEYRSDWDWTKWLPHTQAGEVGRLLSADAVTSGRLMQALIDAWDAAGPNGETRFAGRPGDAAEGPARLVVVDDPAILSGRRSPTRAVLRGAAGPVAGIVVAPSLDRLPAVCSTVVVLRGDLGDAEVHRPQRAEVIVDVVVDGIDAELARRCARTLARYEDPEVEVADAGVPGTVRLLPLLGMEGIDAHVVAQAWAATGNDPAPRCPIGVGADGVVEIDLVADGPHGLVGGTTGSGKSELLRSMVAGMAARVGPEHLVFVLVDYKGGSAFDECARLPHVVGLVTDLDEHLGERALVSLEAELEHRERLLRAAGATDLVEYRRHGSRLGPVPRLVVVLDEFATMAAELPDFLGALVGIAQRGRSLGVHMILATQRPSGAVNANIKANTNLRVALRMQDAGDSVDVIDRADAADISRSTPGRAYVRLGPSDVIAVQTALSTAPPPAADAGVVHLAPFLFGPAPAAASSPWVDDDRPTELEALVGACRDAFAAGGHAAPRRPWLPMLDEELDFDALGLPLTAPPAPAPIVIGVGDVPAEQARQMISWNPDEGHLALLGMAGAGTSTALCTTVLSAAKGAGPNRLHVYGIDYGGGALSALGGLPHVGAIVGAAAREEQIRLVRFLRTELDRRRTIDSRTRADEPLILVAIDNVATFWSDHDGLDGQETAEAFKRIVGDGAVLGIAVALTATRPGDIPMRIMGAVTQRIMFRHADPVDFGAIGLRPEALPAFVPGRAVQGGTKLVVQIARAADPDAVVAEIVAAAAPATRPPRRIGRLPDRVGAAELGAVVAEPDGVVRLPIGVEGDELEPLMLVLDPGEHLFVAGPARSGVSTTLELVARGLRAADDEAVLVAVTEGRSSLLDTGDLFDACGSLRGMETVLRRAARDFSRRWVVVVDDAHLIDNGSILEALAKGGGQQHLRLVVGGRSDQLQGSFSHWSRVVRRGGRGILLQPRLDADGDLLGVRLPRRVGVPFVPGRGFLVSHGVTTLVQVAQTCRPVEAHCERESSQRAFGGRKSGQP